MEEEEEEGKEKEDSNKLFPKAANKPALALVGDKGLQRAAVFPCTQLPEEHTLLATSKTIITFSFTLILIIFLNFATHFPHFYLCK